MEVEREREKASVNDDDDDDDDGGIPQSASTLDKNNIGKSSPLF